jgi:hypothetical protein
MSSFLVSGFGSGAYSAKLLNGTRQRFSGLSQRWQHERLTAGDKNLPYAELRGFDRDPPHPLDTERPPRSLVLEFIGKAVLGIPLIESLLSVSVN